MLSKLLCLIWAQAPKYKRADDYRFVTKPGLTGLWQISGCKNIDWPERMARDIYHIENWSIGLDIAIILKTLKVVITGEGAL